MFRRHQIQKYPVFSNNNRSLEISKRTEIWIVKFFLQINYSNRLSSHEASLFYSPDNHRGSRQRASSYMHGNCDLLVILLFTSNYHLQSDGVWRCVVLFSALFVCLFVCLWMSFLRLCVDHAWIMFESFEMPSWNFHDVLVSFSIKLEWSNRWRSRSLRTKYGAHLSVKWSERVDS